MAQKVPPIIIRLNSNKGFSRISYIDVFESYLFFKHLSLVKSMKQFYTKYLKYKKTPQHRGVNFIFGFDYLV